MKYKVLLLFLCMSSFAYCSYWHELSYHNDIKVHKQKFYEWFQQHNLLQPYARILHALECSDADSIPKHPDAGKVFLRGADSYQLMHNGIKVVKDGYCADWMTDLIFGLQGHHEPQEERVFHEVLQYIPQKAVMIELGSYWGYYSLWFASKIKQPTNYLIEPDQERLDLGKRNFRMNGKNGIFIRGYTGACGTDAGNFQGATPIVIDSFLKERGIDHVNILHADIQGSELEMLQSSLQSIQKKKIDYFFVSTHSEKLHTDCMKFLTSHDYVVIAEHSPEQSYSVDGLVVARRKDVVGPKNIHISKKT